MYAGVTITDPATTYIDEEVEIASDTVILPATILTGKTTIGSWCRIGPGTTIDRSVIGDRCTLQNSVLEEAILEDNVRVGPFGHCRPGAHLAHGVRMGNFGEVKIRILGLKRICITLVTLVMPPLARVSILRLVLSPLTMMESTSITQTSVMMLSSGVIRRSWRLSRLVIMPIQGLALL